MARHSFCRTTCTRRNCTSEDHSPDPEIFEERQGYKLKCSASMFWKVVLNLFRTLELCGVVQVSPGHAVQKELLRWTSKRTPAATSNVGTTLTIKAVSAVPRPPQPGAADPGCRFSTSWRRTSASGVFDFCLSTITKRTRLHSFNQGSAISTESHTTHLWQQIQDSSS